MIYIEVSTLWALVDVLKLNYSGERMFTKHVLERNFVAEIKPKFEMSFFTVSFIIQNKLTILF